MSSTNAFSFDQSKIFSFDKELNPLFTKPAHLINSLPNDKSLATSKLEAFADNKIYVTGKLKFILEMVKKHCGM